MFGTACRTKKAWSSAFREPPNARLLAVYSGPLETGGQLDFSGPV